MPATLGNTTTTDRYQDCTLGGGSLYERGLVVVANNAVSIKVTTASEFGQEQETEYPYVTPTVIPLTSGKPTAQNPKGEKIVQVQVRDAVAGTHAQVSGWLIEPSLAGLDVGSPFTSTVAAGGTVTPGQSSLQFSHDGVLVGTEPILDFEDGTLTTWSVIDDAASTRVQVALGLGGTGTIPFTNPAATYMLTNKLLPADANYSFTLRGDGQMDWGPGGASALQVTMWRSTTNTLQIAPNVRISNFLDVDFAGTGAQLRFGSSLDTNLYRVAANWLQTDGLLRIGGSDSGVANSWLAITPSSSTAYSIGSKTTGDIQYRLFVRADGFLQWGPGNAGPDVDLSRSAAGVLKVGQSFLVANTLFLTGTATTDVKLYKYSTNTLAVGDGTTPGALIAIPSATSSLAIQVLAGNNGPNNYFQILGDGTHQWGAAASSAVDTNLYRLAASSLKTDGAFTAASEIIHSPASASTNSGHSVWISGETNRRWYIDGNGRMLWGAGGASAVDTNLYRNGAGILNTDGIFQIQNSGPVIHASSAGAFQTTVGAAGGASALPATPLKYLKIKDSAGNTVVVPCYNP